MRRSRTQSQGIGTTLGIYTIWLGLTILSAWLAWQWHVTLLYLATLWLHSDLPRPPTWTPAQLAGINKASILVLGSLWLVWIIYLEQDLRWQAAHQRLKARSLQITLATVAILLVSYVLIWITS